MQCARSRFCAIMSLDTSMSAEDPLQIYHIHESYTLPHAWVPEHNLALIRFFHEEGCAVTEVCA